MFVISGRSFNRQGRKIVNVVKCGRYNRLIVISGTKWVRLYCCVGLMNIEHNNGILA